MWEPLDVLGKRKHAFSKGDEANGGGAAVVQTHGPSKSQHSQNVPPELLVLNRFGIGYPFIKAAWALSVKYGIDGRAILFKAGVISEDIWVESQFTLDRERQKAAERYDLEYRLLNRAVNNLHRTKPHYSAHLTFSNAQLLALGICAIVFSLLAYFDARNALPYFLIVISLFYTAVIASRACLLAAYDYRVKATGRQLVPAGGELPVYSILVPLFQEANQIEPLTEHLSNLNWPKAKLDIKLICERDDPETIAAIGKLALPDYFHLVIVPKAEPRTKPKALNYALQLCTGELVVIYDAEDRPSHNQLQEAYQEFLKHDQTLACLQAPLIIQNDNQTWLSRMFHIEYLTLFKGVLPVLASWKMPIPLGGTSNHFKREILEKIGGWDPYNVTEDADLGIRLFREGYRASTISLPTYEEAPPYFIPWLKQRTRWMKGWMQTILVHNRKPGKLFSDLGFVNTLVFHLLLTSIVISSLIHPFFIVMSVMDIYNLRTSLALNHWVTGFATFNLVAGYTTYALLAYVVLRTHKRREIAWSLIFLPFYWLLISLAGWRALVHLIVKPHRWEKTPHGLANETATL